MRHALFLTAITLLLFSTGAQADPVIGKPAPDFTAAAADGGKVTLSSYRGHIVVLEWNNPDCPFVRKHYGSGNMQQLQKFARAHGVIWLTVNSGAPGREGHMDAAQARSYIQRKHLTATHYLLDADGVIGRLYGAKATPHMFVIDAQGNLAYMGAIDDKPTSYVSDIATAHNFVRSALEDLLAGRPVAIPSTQAYGCSVKYAD